MKVEPNVAVDSRQECIWCDADRVTLSDDKTTAKDKLADPAGAFMVFLRTLDPNKCFILALMDIENSQSKAIFYAAQGVARGVGIHVQGMVAPRGEQQRIWDTYRRMKHVELRGKKTAAKRAQSSRGESVR